MMAHQNQQRKKHERTQADKKEGGLGGGIFACLLYPTK